MKSRQTCIIALAFAWVLLLGVSSCYAADREEGSIRALVPKIVDAWGTMNIANVEPYYAADADFAYFDVTPLKYNDWAEYRVGVQKAFFDPNQSIKGAVSDLRVHRRGTLAWATFIAGLDITSKQGAASHLVVRWTMVLEKRAKGWMVVHEHVSAPLGGA